MRVRPVRCLVSGAAFAVVLSGLVVAPARSETADSARNQLTYDELMALPASVGLVDYAAFLPAPDARPPLHTFEGALALRDVQRFGHFQRVGDEHCAPEHDVQQHLPVEPPVYNCGRHLPPFELQFVQRDGELIPARQGLIITGDVQTAYKTYNLIVGTGSVWSEPADRGYSRASFPFALVERNQNCTHNGAMTFLFTDDDISRVRYQVAQETCLPNKFDMWGQLPAAYSKHPVDGAADVTAARGVEVSGRLPTEPISALFEHYPQAGVDVGKLAAVSPHDMTAYGVVFNGVNYVGGCDTRQGPYPYCAELRLPSYSTAKAAFASVALALLGPEAQQRLIRDLVPEARAHPHWAMSEATLGHAADMVTGNYASAADHADESDPNAFAFLEAEPYAAKIAAALNYPHHPGEAGHTWTYHTVDTFLLVQAATELLQQRGDPNADLFGLIRRQVYEPLGLSPGAMSTLRTDNAEAQLGPGPIGRPLGGLGLFFNVDDVAKLATLYQNNGEHNDVQLVDRREMLAALQRSSTDRGVAAVSADRPGTGDGTVAAGGTRYSNGMWAWPTTSQVPGCALRVPFMSGYGGITIAILPNGASFYYFSDNDDFGWGSVVGELDKLAPMCATTTVDVTADASRRPAGDSITLTATVTSPYRSWAPTGTVRFHADGVDVSDPIPLDEAGTATYTATFATRGAHSITASYNPDFTRDTGLSASPVITRLTESCPRGATTCTVESTAGLKIGDTIVMGGSGTSDSHVVTALTETTISWIGAFQRADHDVGEPVWVQNTAGGGFASSTSAAYRHVST